MRCRDCHVELMPGERCPNNCDDRRDEKAKLELVRMHDESKRQGEMILDALNKIQYLLEEIKGRLPL